MIIMSDYLALNNLYIESVSKSNIENELIVKANLMSCKSNSDSKGSAPLITETRYKIIIESKIVIPIVQIVETEFLIFLCKNIL